MRWPGWLTIYSQSGHISTMWDVCITWRKGLKRVWELPTRTHSGLVAPLCGLLPLRFALACRCSRFIVKCLNSSNSMLGLLLDKVCSIKECIHPLDVIPSILLIFWELHFLNLHQSTKNWPGPLYTTACWLIQTFQTWMLFKSCYTLSITLPIWHCTGRTRLILYWSIVVQAYFFFLCLCTMCEVHNK